MEHGSVTEQDRERAREFLAGFDRVDNEDVERLAALLARVEEEAPVSVVGEDRIAIRRFHAGKPAHQVFAHACIIGIEMLSGGVFRDVGICQSNETIEGIELTGYLYPPCIGRAGEVPVRVVPVKGNPGVRIIQTCHST